MIGIGLTSLVTSNQDCTKLLRKRTVLLGEFECTNPCRTYCKFMHFTTISCDHMLFILRKHLLWMKRNMLKANNKRQPEGVNP